MHTSPGYPRQRLLIRLTIATGIPPALGQGLLVLTTDGSVAGALFGFAAMMLPPLFIAWCLLGDASRRALGLVLAYASLFILLGAGLFFGFFWFSVAYIAGSIGGRTAFTLVELAVIAPYLVLGTAAVRTTKELWGTRVVTETGTQLLTVGLMYFAAFAMASEVGSFFSEQERDSALARNDALRPSVFRVQACAIRHALAHPDSGYPRSLAAMGDCLGKRLAADRPKGLVVEYVAAPRDAAGRIPSFVIHARARGKNASSDGAATVFGDTSGLVGDVLSRYEANRVWMHVEVIDEIAQLRTCALLARAQRDGVAPATIADMAATLGRFERGDLRAYLCDTDRLAYAARREAHDSIGASDGYRVSYVPREDGSGRMSEFEIAARPIAYGESGIRSYFVRSDGGIHVTLADRAATASDPITPPCLYGEKRKSLDRYTSTPSCAPMPSLRPPMVTLVHDSVATTGEIFTVAVRRADDPSRAADSTYEHSLACATAKVAPHWRPPRQNGYGDFRLGSELECRVDLESRPPFVNERMRIVVYTRDRTGAFGRAERVVPVVRSNESTRWTSR